MKNNIGIDAIDFYVPPIGLKISDLAIARNIEPAKLEKGLGLKSMALMDVDEDAASMAANALYKLIANNNIDPKIVGRIYLGTESALDAAKPTATYAVGMVEEKLAKQHGLRCFKNCDVVDMTFACVGAVDALENCIDWIKSSSERKAIVIASDVAKYELASTGEYTQGAGAVAMLISSNPSIISFNETFGISMEHVGDFFKPRRLLRNKDLNGDIDIQKITSTNKAVLELFYEEPVFDGQYSNECYAKRIKEGMEHFIEQKNTNLLTDWDKLVFHLPYAFQGRRMMLDIWIDWMKENGKLGDIENEVGKEDHNDIKKWKKSVSKSSLYKTFVKEKIADGEVASGEIGNMYTASIFMSLISHLYVSCENNQELKGKRFGFISYGSGSKSKVFEGTIQNNWKSKTKHLSLFDSLSNRTFIDFETYEKLHNSQYDTPLNEKDDFSLKSISTEKNKEGFRYYH
ncbi:MAG: hydroxymethylglutaryl-CoA synthase [Crocinitomicaceae bacterium]|nr:hydroxymethylglutaryl-CoA synthase [Crocinitomicaceae bacterium]